jgi:hypothetical protein
VAERAWGSVREDYSPEGNAWSALPFDEARRTAYRWNEDGLAGLCDDEQRLCLGVALWNGRDPFVKERAFGLTNSEGNHGEDVKEQFFYVDATPTGSWLKWRYLYPITAFPYQQLRAENAARGRDRAEYELADTGVLDAGCFDVELTVAKAAPDDMCWELTVTNTSNAEAPLHVLPTLWFRNTWSWGHDPHRPQLSLAGPGLLRAEHATLGRMVLAFDAAAGTALFCDNETNTGARYGDRNSPPYPKDGINDHVVAGAATVNPDQTGTKAAVWHQLLVPPGGTVRVRLRLAADTGQRPDLDAGFEEVMRTRAAEADEFHTGLQPTGTSSQDAAIVRQALAGLVWGRCFYHYNVTRWVDGDPSQPAPPPGRGTIRNGTWRHLDAKDVISMPDPWEYPWFAAWDLAFHTVAVAHADPEFAKDQLLLLTREWYSHPNGQLPAYEWNFSDVNPPVHAWAALEVFHIAGGDDHAFLARIFHKLLLNFTWWVNRVDAQGDNAFEGGFLGMDNIGSFDRSHQPPVAGILEQSDGTAWMAMYCLDLLEMALTLALHDRAYEDVAVKFFEHFTHIAAAMDTVGLWDETDGFLYDVLQLPDGTRVPMRIRSVAGLVALAATRMVSAETLAALPTFAQRVRWFLTHRPTQAAGCSDVTDGALVLAALPPQRLRRVLAAVLDEEEFYSPHGLRSLSRRHAAAPFTANVSGYTLGPVTYEPGESSTGLFGGNSNWRGPVWLPINHLVVTALRRYHSYLGEEFTVELPTGSGRQECLGAVADDLADRLVSLLRPSDAAGDVVAAAGDRPWPSGLLLFHEYFHGDTGAGLGASHQTGWTALLADLVLRHLPHMRP